MAITTSQYIINAGWARTDTIDQLEKAWTAISWNGAAESGIVTYISATNVGGGGTVGTASSAYYDVRANITSGVGTGASFDLLRNNGAIYAKYVNRTGTGYTTGEVVTIKADQIGGTSNGATDLILTLKIDAGIGTYGGANKFLTKENPTTANNGKPWGCAKLTIDEAKEYGNTYRTFQMYDDTQMEMCVGSGFMPYKSPDNALRSNETGYGPRFEGSFLLDYPMQPPTDSGSRFRSDLSSQGQQYYGCWGPSNNGREPICSSRSYQLDLNLFRSGLDPKFVVWSYRQPTLSSTKLRDNTFLTYILHNYTGDLWDLDDQFLGGITTIHPSGDDNQPHLDFRTYPCGTIRKLSSYYPSKRSAEAGYMSWGSGESGQMNSSGYMNTVYKSTNNQNSNYNHYVGMYVRNNTQDDPYVNRSDGGWNLSDNLPDSTNYNAVVKGIPLQAAFIPTPYYMPDDFVLIDFHHNAPSANIQQYDTVTISGSEVYTVIQGSYDQSGSTNGILFCARTT